MKIWMAIGLMALAAGCSSRQPASPANADEQPAARESSSVTLDAAAQQTAGIVCEPAAERAVPEVIRASARLANDENRTWRVGAITEGRIAHVLASPGDVVEAGRPLARIHSHEVRDSRAEYSKALTEVSRATASVDYSRAVRDRARRLHELKAGSLEQVERGEIEVRNAEAMLATAESERARARSRLVEYLGVPPEDGDGAAIESETREGDLIPVRSPASGVVLIRNVTPGTVVTPADDLFVISDLATLWAIAEVNEEHLSKLRPGMAVRLFVQAWPDRPFAGRIAQLGETLDPATRTVKVRVEVPNPQGRLKPEMYATAEIQTAASSPGIFVPEEAVQETRGQSVVFVRQSESRFEARPVETGRVLDGAIEIRRGLSEGEQVVRRGAFILKAEYLKAALSGE